MGELLGFIEETSLAQGLRFSRWGYAAVNAAHIIGIAMLVGGIIPLNLRLLGAWPSVERAALAKVLVPVAACGLILAVTTGALLFSVRAREYADLSVVQLKLSFVAAGVLSALFLHWKSGLLLMSASATQLRAHGLISLCCWLGALICGRLIGFMT